MIYRWKKKVDSQNLRLPVSQGRAKLNDGFLFFLRDVTPLQVSLQVIHPSQSAALSTPWQAFHKYQKTKRKALGWHISRHIRSKKKMATPNESYMKSRQRCRSRIKKMLLNKRRKKRSCFLGDTCILWQ